MPPIGWYLAQGLIPLGPDSSDDDEGPAELPNGRLVCGPHGLECCGRCCVDYGSMNEALSSEDEDEDSDENGDEGEDLPDLVDATPNLNPVDSEPWDAMTRGTGRVFPKEFTPPSASITPSELFSDQRNHMMVTRHVLRDPRTTGQEGANQISHSISYTLTGDPGKVLIRTDGACLDNGQPDLEPRAGWAFWHGSGPSGNLLTVSGRLEKKGPFGDDAEQASNRAELRAVIAALRFRFWPGEGVKTLVIATDSEYVVKGATEWAKKWVDNGWVTRLRGPVKNRDLWEALLGEIERFSDEGMNIEFWRVPREWNMVADTAAKQAAADGEAPARWANIIGMNI